MRVKNRHLRMILSCAAFLAGIVFAACGAFVTPPPGIIDSSLLIFIAQCFVLSATFIGFKADFDMRELRFKTEDKLNDKDPEELEEEYEEERRQPKRPPRIRDK